MIEIIYLGSQVIIDNIKKKSIHIQTRYFDMLCLYTAKSIVLKYTRIRFRYNIRYIPNKNSIQYYFTFILHNVSSYCISKF